MAESIVTLRVDTRNAVSSLNNASAATNKLSAASSGATKSLAATSTAARGLGSALASSLAPILAVGTAVSLLGRSLSVFQSRERDAAILAKGLNNLGKGTNVLRELEEAADNLGNATLFSQDEFTRGFALLTSFRKIGVNSYASVAEQAANIAQINQVDVNTSFMQLAKALQDPERNLSNLNRSGIAFSKQQTDVIKQLMKTNQVAKAHTMILDIVKESYDEAALAASKGFAGSVDLLMEEVNDFSESLGKALLPVLDKSVKALTAFLDFLNSEGGQVTAIIAGITLAVKGLAVALPLLKTNLIAVAVSARIATGNLIGTKATLAATSIGFANATVAANAFKVALAKAGIGLAIIAFGILATKILETFNAQKRLNEELAAGKTDLARAELERLEKKLADLQAKQERIKKQGGLKNILGLGEKLSGTEVIELIGGALPKAIDDLKAKIATADELGFAKEFRTAAKNIHEQKEELEEIIKRSKINTEEGRKQFDLEQRKNELVEKHGELLGGVLFKREQDNKKLQESVNKIKEQEKAAEKLKEKYKEIGQSVEDGIVSNLADAVEGTKTLAQAAVSVLNDLKRKLIEVAIQQAVSGIGGKIGGFLGKVFGGGKAAGGPVAANKNFIVGEKGPEILSMGSSRGFITPNNQIGGEVTNIVTVNVDASGSSVEGNDGQANEFGNVLAAAIQAELINQKRAGGLLSNA